ncbi:MAG: FtsX-like permease family protein [Chitinophagaceae bacterium]|nr:FtsX-like permease family protein [Chitinophagaceae bacterium]
MIKAFFKVAIRNLSRNKVYSTINIVSLSIGLAACLLVANVVIDDLSYDKQWQKAPDIYRISDTDESTGQKTPVVLSGLGPTLKKDFPEVENYCRVSDANKYFTDSSKGKFNIHCIITEPSFLDIFNFRFIANATLTGGKDYKSVILSEEAKNKYFGNADPIGKTLKGFGLTGDADPTSYIVTGIVESIPYNSHLRAEAIILSQFSDEDNQLSPQGIGGFYSLYILLQPSANIKNLETKIDHLYKIAVENGADRKFVLQPLQDIYLHSDFAQGYQTVVGSLRSVYIFSAVAIVLLLIACFNFINLTTARALKKVGEAGVRKILGAGKFQLVLQYLFESLIFFLISFLLAVVFYRLFLNGVETYLEHKLTVSFTQNIILFAATVLVLLLVCLFTGLYPAILLASTKMITALKGATNSKPGNNRVRKSLIVGQFVITIIIIIAAIVVKEQLFFLNHSELGYDKNNLLLIGNTNFSTSGTAFKTEIKKITGVENASITIWNPGIGGGAMSVKVDNPFQKEKKMDIWYIDADIDFVSTLPLRLEQGRLLNNAFFLDAPDTRSLYKSGNMDSMMYVSSNQSLLVSSYTAKTFTSIQLNQPSKSMPGTPVGVVSNFHNESLRTIMKPSVIRGDNNIRYGNMLIRIQPGTDKYVIAAIAKIWDKFYPSQTFNYSWVNDALAAQYDSEKKTLQLFFFFSYISIFLACMGLFGLVSFTTEMRVKEIGIRKVLGASAALITVLISKDFLKLVVVALLISAPIAVWLMHAWLEDYAYRINISGWFIFVAGFITIAIAAATVFVSSINAATANPVAALRSE